MGHIELVLIAVGVSMDAFAVSLCKGLGMRRMRWGQALVLGLLFGGFQAIMPLIGWAVGSRFMWLIEPVDHWVAFALLLLIGAKMILDVISEADELSCPTDKHLDVGESLMLAIATSIDALAVGISFAALEVSIGHAVMLVGLTTFIFSVVGVGMGTAFGSRWKRPASIIGGLILILIGVKVLLQHLGIVSLW